MYLFYKFDTMSINNYLFEFLSLTKNSQIFAIKQNKTGVTHEKNNYDYGIHRWIKCSSSTTTC